MGNIGIYWCYVGDYRSRNRYRDPKPQQIQATTSTMTMRPSRKITPLSKYSRFGCNPSLNKDRSYTACQWYKSLQYNQQNRKLSHGWRDAPDPTKSWHKQLITFQEFEYRYALCSIQSEHESRLPFDFTNCNRCGATGCGN
jgi:hypothetical protein